MAIGARHGASFQKHNPSHSAHTGQMPDSTRAGSQWYARRQRGFLTSRVLDRESQQLDELVSREFRAAKDRAEQRLLDRLAGMNRDHCTSLRRTQHDEALE